MLDVDLDKENAAVHELTASRAPLDMKRERRKANVVFGKHRPRPAARIGASIRPRPLLP